MTERGCGDVRERDVVHFDQPLFARHAVERLLVVRVDLLAHASVAHAQVMGSHVAHHEPHTRLGVLLVQNAHARANRLHGGA